MQIDILTLFPKMIQGFLDESIIKRAQNNKIVNINIYDLRHWTTDRHHTVDDAPYGGGAGMILKVDVIDKALYYLKLKANGHASQKQIAILLTPQGKRFTQQIAKKLAKINHLILICGHYGGFDERIRKLVDMEISLGDFVLTGGEIPAVALSDAIIRLLPSTINKESLINETHSKKGAKQYPLYTRPENYTPVSKNLKNLSVPEVLKSGNHKDIENWRDKNMKN